MARKLILGHYLASNSRSYSSCSFHRNAARDTNTGKNGDGNSGDGKTGNGKNHTDLNRQPQYDEALLGEDEEELWQEKLSELARFTYAIRTLSRRDVRSY